MIEGARKVQSQWMESDEELKEKLKKGMSELPSPPPEPTEGVKETRRGPLEADHLREAHRRYKLSSEGNLVGQLGLWQLQQNGGIERFGTKVGGKRLFK
jgi:transcription initiation factor TFIID subunit 11